jgi:hypothetical protein
MKQADGHGSSRILCLARLHLTPEDFCFRLVAPPPEFSSLRRSIAKTALLFSGHPHNTWTTTGELTRASFWIMRISTVLACASAVYSMPLCGDVTPVGKAAGG